VSPAGMTAEDATAVPDDADAEEAVARDTDVAIEGSLDSTSDDDPTSVQPTTDVSGGGWASGPPPPTAPWEMPPSPVPGDGTATHVHEPDRRQRHRHRHLVGPGVFGVLLIWTGVAWLTGVGLTTALAVGLVILGLGFVLGSFVGGSRALIFPALLVAVALAMTAFIDIPFSGPIGEQYWSPATRTQLEEVDAYDVSMGEGTLDLSELVLLRRETSVTATVGLGHLVVLVPEDQDVSVNTEVGAGEVVVFGREQNGVGFETHDSFPGDGATLILDLEVGMGQIEVRRVESDQRVEPVEPR
jgi:predicted membrane protein